MDDRDRSKLRKEAEGLMRRLMLKEKIGAS